MRPIRLLAAALVASAGLALSLPASAAPASAAAVAPGGFRSAAPVAPAIQAGYWDRDANRWVETDRSTDRRADRQDRRADWRDDRRDRRSDWRDNRRDRRADWRDDRRDRRADWRDQRRDDRWDRRRDHRWEDRRGYRWDRGNHYGWDRGGHKYYKHKHKHWRAGHHPRYRYWAGRRIPRHYVVIERYNDYYLPPPRRGHYYARVDNDVFLVAQATHLIVDAFVLLDAARRY